MYLDLFQILWILRTLR